MQERKSITTIREQRFLLDESVDYGLVNLMRDDGLRVATIQDHGWKGYKNGELSLEITHLDDTVFLTRDRGFQYTWEKYQLKVIYLMIHPPKAEKLWRELKSLIDNWKWEFDNPFLVRLQIGSSRITR